MLKVTVVGQARLGLVVQADLQVLILDLHLAGEAGKCTQATDSIVPGGSNVAQPQQSLPQLGGEDRGQ
jgi:hypothetical protein